MGLVDRISSSWQNLPNGSFHRSISPNNDLYVDIDIDIDIFQKICTANSTLNCFTLEPKHTYNTVVV